MNRKRLKPGTKITSGRRVGVIVGMSPSTKRRRGPDGWRYKIKWNGEAGIDFRSERDIEAVT